jgi:serralysin
VNGTISDTFGGFGGGGNGTAITYESGGGGGGGYAGGGGGNGLQNGAGGGGGSSYNSGSNAQNINVTNSGAGTARFVFLDADTTPPSITSGSSFSTSENSTSIATLTVNETSTWSIFSGVDSLTVSIDTNTGLLRFKIGQNYESPGDADSNRSYLFTVKATDEADNSSTASITVTLTDLNEAPVITSNSGGASASITISENTSLVTSVATTDPDSVSALSYSVSGTDANDFAIGVSSGVLTFATLPNFEAPVDLDLNNIYLLVVEVSDGFLTDTQTITITVTNVTDAVAISTPTLSAPPSKGVTTTITYQLDVAGRATFFASGKRIPGCITKITSGGSPITASCSWKPATSGAVSISVSIKPTGSGTATTNSSSTIYQVVRRTGIR